MSALPPDFSELAEQAPMRRKGKVCRVRQTTSTVDRAKGEDYLGDCGAVAKCVTTTKVMSSEHGGGEAAKLLMKMESRTENKVEGKRCGGWHSPGVARVCDWLS